MKKNYDLRLEFLNRQYFSNKRRFDIMMKFIKSEHEFVQSWHISGTDRMIPSNIPAKEKLFIIFVDCINASGGNNLKNTGISCKNFYNILKKLSNGNQIEFNEFTKYFSPEDESLNGIFKKLISDKYKNIKHKKAALFIRTLYILQEYTNKKIFKNIKITENDLYIPLDVVITDLLNRMLLISFDNKKKIKSSRDFKIIDEFSRKILLDDFMLIEDLWFWGFFNTQIEKEKNGYRKVCFNEDKFYSLKYVFPNEMDKSKFTRFRHNFNQTIEQ